MNILERSSTIIDPATATTYCGPAMAPGEWLARWNFDPVFVTIMVLAALAYRALPSRRRDDPQTGWAVLAALGFLYVSPFCAAGSALFTVRVVHHLLLAIAVAPMLARLLAPILSKVPGGLAAWTIVAAAAMWAWHAPNLYHHAATDSAAYWAMQLTILASATMFWDRIARRSDPAAIAALLAAMVAMGALGALITLAPQALYPAHFDTTAAWGLTPIEDQQIAGLLMWAPAAAAYLVVALARVRGMIGAEMAT